MKFKPSSQHERHQKYFEAFSVSDKISRPYIHIESDVLNKTSLNGYLDYITKYITDPNISYHNHDDIEFFKDLLFEGLYGKIHIFYYRNIFDKWMRFAFEQSIFILSKYASFLSKISPLYLHDFYDYMLGNRYIKSNSNYDWIKIISSLYDNLDPEAKIEFIRVASNYKDIVSQLPQIKLYMTYL